MLAVLLFAVGCNGEPPAPPVVAPPLPPPVIRREAVELPDGEPREADRVAFYLRLLSRGHEEEVRWASGQLRLVGDAAVKPLLDLLEKNLVKNPLLAENVLRVLAEQVPAPKAVDRIAGARGAKDGRVRMDCARALGNTGSRDAVAPLLDLSSDPQDLVALAAIESIEKLGYQEGATGLLGRFPDRLTPRALSAAVPVLARMLEPDTATSFLTSTFELPDVGLILTAGAELIAMDREAWLPRVREKLAPLLTSEFREPAREVLARGADPELLPDLLREAASDNPGEALGAIWRLPHYRQEAAIQALWKAALGKNPNLRREAFNALIDAGEDKALERLVGLLQSPEPADRNLAALVLAARPGYPSGPAMAKALEIEEEHEVRLRLAVGVALLRYVEGSTAIASLLAREEEQVPSLAVTANTAATALYNLGALSPGALAKIIQLAASESAAIRMNAARVLGRVCSGPEVTKALRTLISDPVADVRRQAIESWLMLEKADVKVLLDRYAFETDDDIADRLRRIIRQLVHRWPQ